MISEYTAVEAWHGRSYAWEGCSYAWRGRSYAWGGRSYAWGAPVMPVDGQASIFPLDNLFGSGADYTLQTVAFPPHLPDWLTPVGQAYQVSGHGTSGHSAILFRYLPRDVPAGYEDGLSIYYLPDTGATWQRLTTQIDTQSNQASATLPGDGIYLLVATVEVRPAFVPGWNIFGYPIQQAQPTATALASIVDAHSIVYIYDVATQSWTMYAPSVPAPFSNIINTLQQFDYAHSYWIYATRPVTLYWGVTPNAATVSSSSLDQSGAAGPPAAPAVYYGWLTPAANFAPTVGQRITAEINGVVCGETAIQMIEGQLAYVLLVKATDSSDPSVTCGAWGRISSSGLTIRSWVTIRGGIIVRRGFIRSGMGKCRHSQYPGRFICR